MGIKVRLLTAILVVLSARKSEGNGISPEGLEPPPSRSGVRLMGGAYEGLVVSVEEGVPKEECSNLLEGLESVITDASARLYNALGGRAWFRTVTILLPNSWMDDANDGGKICGRDEVSAAWARGESASTADLRVTASPHPLFGDSSWARQSGGCGAPGDFIEVTHSRVADHREDLGAVLVRDWAKYRYGVFDEAGIGGDPVFPLCYRGQDPTTSKVTGCSDLPIGTAGPCEKLTEYEHFFGNVSHLLHPNATSSIMFDPTAPQVTKFCNASTHDRYAPTKHNLMCDRKSVMEVILQHPDFSNNLEMDFEDGIGMSVETKPQFSYKREELTRYILVVEDTKHMLIRESWTFLRTAVRKLAFYDLPGEGSVEVGLVGAMEGGATRLHPVSALTGSDTRDTLASCLPYNPGDSASSHVSPPSSSSACLHCGIKEALDMLEERSRAFGPAASVIIIVSAGMETESGLPSSRSLWTQVARANSIHVPLSTINYPNVGTGRQPLDQLAAATGGLAFTVPEKRVSVSESHLSAYMALSRTFVAIRDEFQRGGANALPIEIHYRELHDEDIERSRQMTQGTVGSPGAGTTVITGSFVVEDSLVDTGSVGWPRRDSPVSSRFVLFTYKPENPLVRRIELVSPSNRIYRTRSDALSSIRALTLQAALNESGTWTYTVERFIGTPQPLYIQVTSTPKTKTAPVIRARAWASSSVVRPGTSDPVVLYVEVKKGNWPVVGARVEVQVRMWPSNDSSPAHVSQHHTYRESEQRRFLLLDTGSGDPDITKGDGVYSRYFVPPIPSASTPSEQVLYIMDISVTDDGNTAYTWLSVQNSQPISSCCGSSLRPEALAPLPSFQRVLPPLSLSTMKRSPLMNGMPLPPVVEPPPSKVGDLRSEVLAAETRARLTWTAPGAHGDFGTVDSYEVRFSRNLATIADNFDSATPWEKGRPFPLAPGSDTSFTLDFVGETALLDVSLFFAIRATSARGDLPPLFGRASNVVRVLVPSPPPPPPPPPPPVLLHPGGHIGNGSDGDLTDLVVVPQRAGLASGVGMALQVILPAAVGILLLVGVLGVYFFLVAQRRRRTAKKHQHKPSMNTSTTTTYTSANTNSRNGPMPTPPPAYEPRLTEEGVKSDNLVRWIGENDGSAKRFSLGDDMPNVTSSHPDPRGARLSVICGKEVNGMPPDVPQLRTLSPYQSWTASQLLHEHERRHSPYGYTTGPIMQQSNQNSACGDESWMVGPPQQFSGSSQGQPSINGSTHNSIMGMSHNSRTPNNMGMVNGEGDLEGQWMQNHMNGDGPCHVHPRDQMGNVVEGSFLSLVDESNTSSAGVSRGSGKVPPPVAPKPILHHGLGFNPSSHQGSLTSVRSSALDKKKRNVTQV